MRGSLREKADNRWELRVYAGIDVQTGKKRWVSRTVRGSRSEAEAELASLSDQVDYPRRRASGTTMGELLSTWYELASPHWAPNTRRHTRSVIDVHLVPRFGHLAVGKVTTVDLDDFDAELLVRGAHDGKPLKPGTVQRIHGVLRRALTQAVRWEWIWDNPAVYARAPRVDQREIYSPPPKAVAQLVAAAARLPGLAMYFRLAATTGAPRSGAGAALVGRGSRAWGDLVLEVGV